VIKSYQFTKCILTVRVFAQTKFCMLSPSRITFSHNADVISQPMFMSVY